MPKNCCVDGCKNRTTPGCRLHFYKMPEKNTPFEQRRREDWIRAVQRDDWKTWAPDRISKQNICSAHFISGARNEHNSEDPDFVPSLFLKKDNTCKKSVKQRELNESEYIREAGFVYEELKEQDFSSIHRIDKSAITNGLMYELLSVISPSQQFAVFTVLCGNSIEVSEKSFNVFQDRCSTLRKDGKQCLKHSKSTLCDYTRKVFDFPYQLYPARDVCTDTSEPMSVVCHSHETIASPCDQREEISTFLNEISEPRPAVTISESVSADPLSFSLTSDTEIHQPVALPMETPKNYHDTSIGSETQTSSLLLAGDVERNPGPFMPIEFIPLAGFNYHEIKDLEFSSIHTIEKSQITNGLIYELSSVLNLTEQKLFNIFSILCSSTIALPECASSTFKSRVRTMKNHRSRALTRHKGLYYVFSYKPFDFPYEAYSANDNSTPVTQVSMPTNSTVSVDGQQTINNQNASTWHRPHTSSHLLEDSEEKPGSRAISLKFIREAGFNYAQLKRADFSLIHSLEKSKITNGLIYELSTLMSYRKLLKLLSIMCNNSIAVSKQSLAVLISQYNKMISRRFLLSHRDTELFDKFCYKAFDFPYEAYPASDDDCTPHVSIPTTTSVSVIYQETTATSATKNTCEPRKIAPVVSTEMLVPVTFLVPAPMVEPFRASVEAHVNQTMKESAKIQNTVMPQMIQPSRESVLAPMTFQIPKAIPKPPLAPTVALPHEPTTTKPPTTKRRAPVISILHTLAAKSKERSLPTAATSQSVSELHCNNVPPVYEPMTPSTTVKTSTPSTVTIAARCSTSTSKTSFFKNIAVAIRAPSSSSSTLVSSSSLLSSQSSSPSSTISDQEASSSKLEQATDSTPSYCGISMDESLPLVIDMQQTKLQDTQHDDKMSTDIMTLTTSVTKNVHETVDRNEQPSYSSSETLSMSSLTTTVDSVSDNLAITEPILSTVSTLTSTKTLPHNSPLSGSVLYEPVNEGSDSNSEDAGELSDDEYAAVYNDPVFVPPSSPSTLSASSNDSCSLETDEEFGTHNVGAVYNDIPITVPQSSPSQMRNIDIANDSCSKTSVIEVQLSNPTTGVFCNNSPITVPNLSTPSSASDVISSYSCGLETEGQLSTQDDDMVYNILPKTPSTQPSTSTNSKSSVIEGQPSNSEVDLTCNEELSIQDDGVICNNVPVDVPTLSIPSKTNTDDVANASSSKTSEIEEQPSTQDDDIMVYNNLPITATTPSTPPSTNAVVASDSYSPETEGETSTQAVAVICNNIPVHVPTLPTPSRISNDVIAYDSYGKIIEIEDLWKILDVRVVCYRLPNIIPEPSQPSTSSSVPKRKSKTKKTAVRTRSFRTQTSKRTIQTAFEIDNIVKSILYYKKCCLSLAKENKELYTQVLAKRKRRKSKKVQTEKTVPYESEDDQQLEDYDSDCGYCK